MSRSALSPALLARLRAIVGRRNVLTGIATGPFAKGYRDGRGDTDAVVRPGTLVEMWRVLEACVMQDAIVVMQAANTGLTGGSTPRDAGYDRPVVVLSAMRIKGIRLVDGARQAICLPGSTLHELERALAPHGREPHSVIGSSCIGASVIGGICNNSGGALVRRGPAYTEMALYARVDETGHLRLENTLGADLDDDPEKALAQIDAGTFDIQPQPVGRAGSSRDYERTVRAIAADMPARFNADPAHLSGASGSAGRVAVFAVRVDTFPAEGEERTFYLGTNDPDCLARLRRDVLANFAELPISGEYIHRDAFDMADRYGKDTYLAIRLLGTERLPALFAAKARIDGVLQRAGLGRAAWTDRVLQAGARLAPDHLPRRLRMFRDRYEHHLVVKVAGGGIDELRCYLEGWAQAAVADWHECSATEAQAAFLHRFAVAGAAIRLRTIDAHRLAGLVSIDVALPRNCVDWVEWLPPELERRIAAKVYYGHFFCHVFHQDYLVAAGEDPAEVEAAILMTLDARGGRYPAEHNVGHHYAAAPAQIAFFRDLDPGNRFNPGIGRTPGGRDWREP